MSDKGVKFVIGIYDDEDILLDAISSVRGKGVNIHEVYSPFPVHGIEDRLGYKRSRLSIAAFCFGFLGTCLALTMMIGMMTCCITMPLIIAAVFCGLYWSLWAQANWANDNFQNGILYTEDYPYYATCGFGTIATGED